MISQSAAQTLFAYHWHTGHRLLELAAQLADAQYRAVPAPNQRSAHELLRHVLVTDWAWRVGLESGRQPEPPPTTEFSDLASLREGYAAEEAAWGALLGSLSDADIAADLTLTALNGYVCPWRAGAWCNTWRSTACSTMPSWPNSSLPTATRRATSTLSSSAGHNLL